MSQIIPKLISENRFDRTVTATLNDDTIVIINSVSYDNYVDINTILPNMSATDPAIVNQTMMMRYQSFLNALTQQLSG